MAQATLIPVYTTKGDAEAFLAYPYLFNRNGEWIGFVTPQRDVYSVLGEYVGMLTNDPRIVRKKSTSSLAPLVQPPASPPRKIYPPASVPLAPMMPELNHSVIDVLQEQPERLHTIDSGDSRQDMD
ncbi:MAG: hypothetical protein Q8L87_04990 [Anaerolineales bacterium]|jgi:hypothetical protein|nr:hypothetical protein [Anaerolineales bacterium]